MSPPNRPEGQHRREASIGFVFGEQLARVRRRKGWSQQKLADEMTRVGVSMNQSAIAKIEPGETDRRAVKVEEAFAFALVLGVSPIALFVPRDRSTAVRIGTAEPQSQRRLLDWIRGLEQSHGAFQVPTGTADERRFFYDERTEIEETAIRDLPVLFYLFQAMADALDRAGRPDEPDRIRAAFDGTLLARLIDIRDYLDHAIKLVEQGTPADGHEGATRGAR